MVIQYVKLRTTLSEEELLRVGREREPQFRAIPGLLQKYYVRRGEPGEYGGIYVWDSRESLADFQESMLARTIPQAYQLAEPPEIEVVDVLFKLRDSARSRRSPQLPG